MSLTFVLGARGPEAAASSSGAMRTGYTQTVNGYQPADTTAEIWMKSDVIWGNQDGEQYDVTADCGDDDGEGTEADPIKSFEELERRLRGGFGQGCHVIVRLMGSDGANFDSPEKGRLYFTREARISYGNGSPEAFRSNITYVGPRNYLVQAGPYYLISATDVSNGSRRIGKTRLLFSLTPGGPATSVSAATYHIRWVRAADGREVIAPFGCEKNVNDGSVHVGIAAAATFNGYHQFGDQFYVVIPAAAIAADGLDTQFRGVNICGQGPYRVGDRVSAEAPLVDKNPWPHFERVAFVGRTVITVSGDLMIDGSNFRDHVSVGPTTRLRSRNNCVEGYLSYNGGPVFRTNSAQLDPRLDPSCRMLEYDDNQALDTQRNTQTSNPDDAVHGQDWSISGQGAGIFVGEDLGGFPASFRVLKGIALNCETGAHTGIKCYAKSNLYIANAARACVTMGGDPSDIAFWAVGGATMRLNDGPCSILQGGTPVDFAEFAGPAVYGITADVKVGNETAVAFGTSAGQLREVAGINGNYISDYDNSRAWTPSSEPDNYGKAGG